LDPYFRILYDWPKNGNILQFFATVRINIFNWMHGEKSSMHVRVLENKIRIYVYYKKPIKQMSLSCYRHRQSCTNEQESLVLYYLPVRVFLFQFYSYQVSLPLFFQRTCSFFSIIWTHHCTPWILTVSLPLSLQFNRSSSVN